MTWTSTLTTRGRPTSCRCVLLPCCHAGAAGAAVLLVLLVLLSCWCCCCCCPAGAAAAACHAGALQAAVRHVCQESSHVPRLSIGVAEAVLLRHRARCPPPAPCCWHHPHRLLAAPIPLPPLPLPAAQSLADAVDAGDVDAFTTAVAEFDSLTRLDAWKTALLVRVKRKIGTRDELDEEDLT